MKMYLTLSFAVLVQYCVLICADIVDIKSEIPLLLKAHNNERSNEWLQASDMTRMHWDRRLAKQAEDYSSKCEYKRPPRDLGVGANLFYERKHVQSHHTIHRFVNRALQLWTRDAKQFVYSNNCRRTCSYTQMIYAKADRIGCAVQRCASVKSARSRTRFVSLFVCFYSDGANIASTLPYTRGRPCETCAMDRCKERLCNQMTSGSALAPADYQLDHTHDTYRPGMDPEHPGLDRLSASEARNIVQVTNTIRQDRGLKPLAWDDRLERWSEWIVNCGADYPGPAYTYSNFHRLIQGMSSYKMVYDWVKEGDDEHLQMIHGCRTAHDNTLCNHYTNICQPQITSIACATRDCNDGTRQLVCLYADVRDLPFRRRTNSNSMGRYRRTRLQ